MGVFGTLTVGVMAGTRRPARSTVLLVLATLTVHWPPASKGADFASDLNDVTLLTRTALQATFEGCLKKNSITALRKQDADYESWRVRIQQSDYINRYPNFILLPKTEAQVQSAMSCLHQFNVPFVIRSGGHSYRGFSSLGCGAVVDLSHLNTIAVQNSRATVGAGVTLGPLYRTLWLNGKLIFPGGTCPSVAASGLLLSGGQGLLSRKLGLAVDSILAARVLLPNGTLLTTNSTRHSDLFYAIRGGSGSYGVVTQWTLQAHAAPPAFIQLEMSFSWSKANVQRVLTGLFEEQPWTWPQDVTNVRLYLGKGKEVPMRLVILYWGTMAQLRAFLSTRPFFKTGPRNTTLLSRQGSFIDAQLRGAALGSSRAVTLDDLRDARIRAAPKSHTLHFPAYSRGVLPAKGCQVITDWVDSGCGSASVMFLGGAAGQQRSGQTAYDVHRPSSVIYSFTASCSSRASRIRDIRTKFAPYTTGLQYMGYLSDVPAGSDPWLVAFGNATASRLKSIRDKYDPGRRLHALNEHVCR